MKKLVFLSVCMAVMLGICGCSWSTDGDNVSWSDSYNWVNFSGTYRHALGGVLVTDYTTTPSVPGTTNKVSYTETATLPANESTLSGNTRYSPVNPGSFSISIGGGITLADDGTGKLQGTGGSGIITTEGVWGFTLETGFFDPTQPQSITISYTYLVANDGTSGGSVTPGSSGATIYSFIITHQGQNLTIQDNNGATYSGYITGMSSSSGATNTETGMPVDGDTIIATFKCSGTSAAGISVTITGSLQGTVATSVFAGRTISGTWIESGGKTGDINGQAGSVVVYYTSSDSTTE